MSLATLTAPSDASRITAQPRAVDTTVPEAVAPAPAARVVAYTPELRQKYDVFVAGHRHGTLFHTTGWLDSVGKTFPHEPIHLVALRSDPGTQPLERAQRIVGVLPLFLVHSRLGGRMMVSVPYGVGGGVLADSADVASHLFDHATALAQQERVRCLELRSRVAELPGLPVDHRYVTFERELPSRTDDVLEWLPRKARAAARNGRDRFCLTIEYGNEHLPEVWRLYTANMRRLASIAYPHRFVEQLCTAFTDHTWVSLVRRDGRPIAGLITFLYRDRVMPYFFGCTAEARRCSAANFAYFKTMKRAVAAGFRIFDFGRSRRDNAGSFDFKRFHGFEPTPLEYQRLVVAGETAPELSPNSARYRLARRVWPFLPLKLTQVAGGYLSRHIPG